MCKALGLGPQHHKDIKRSQDFQTVTGILDFYLIQCQKISHYNSCLGRASQSIRVTSITQIGQICLETPLAVGSLVPCFLHGPHSLTLQPLLVLQILPICVLEARQIQYTSYTAVAQLPFILYIALLLTLSLFCFHAISGKKMIPFL